MHQHCRATGSESQARVPPMNARISPSDKQLLQDFSSPCRALAGLANFPVPRRSAHQHHVGNIQGRDQQHHTGHRNEENRRECHAVVARRIGRHAISRGEPVNDKSLGLVFSGIGLAMAIPQPPRAMLGGLHESSLLAASYYHQHMVVPRGELQPCPRNRSSSIRTCPV